MKYLATIMARGHPIEYFIEGGRSRTGRLLQPKTGMLSMTVRGFLHAPVRPVVFIPVYFGYERLVEGRTYLGELSGQPKEKESVLGLLRSWRVLRERFGKVHVNLGEPIALDGILDRHHAPWRAERFAEEVRSPWVAPRGGCARAGHHAQHQFRRRGVTHQSHRAHAAGHAAPGAPGSRPRAPARAVPLAPDRCPLQRARHGDRAPAVPR